MTVAVFGVSRPFVGTAFVHLIDCDLVVGCMLSFVMKKQSVGNVKTQILRLRASNSEQQ